MHLMSVKEIVSQAALEIGTAMVRVDHVFGSNDQDIVQMGALLSAVADELLIEEPYKYQLGDHVWATSSTGEPKHEPDQDIDVILFDSRVVIDGLKYRFLQAKGLEFAEQLRDYTSRLNKLAASSNPRVLDLDADEDRVR